MPRNFAAQPNQKSALGITLICALGAALIGIFAIISSHAAATCTGGPSGDINCDNKVDITDLSLMLTAFGTSGNAADLNSSGHVDIIDLSTLLTNFGHPITPTTVTAAITAPLNGATITGTVPWTATATATSAKTITKVEFYIDGQLQWTDTAAPFDFRRDPAGWNTVADSNNMHDIVVRAYDAAGTVASAKARIYIQNHIAGGLGPDRSVLSKDPYAAHNVWYTPLPATTPVDPNSVNIIGDIKTQIKTYYGTAGFNTKDFSPSLYMTDATSAKVAVGFYDCQNKGYFDPSLKLQWTGVPMPVQAQPSSGTDREMMVYDVANKTMYEFWKTTKVNNKWYACWGGKMSNMDTNLGIFPRPYGTTATGLPFLGSTITWQELQTGVIPHAVGIALVHARAGGQSWPALRHDGGGWAGVDPTTIPWEGQRFRLDPTVNVDAMNLHPVAKMIAKAMQKYGMVVRDQAGDVTFYAENTTIYTNAGVTNPAIAIFNGSPSYALMNGFPWDKVQALPKDYGSPSGW